jgi:hypothetical protein
MSLENCSNEHTIDFIAKSFFVFMISLSFINDVFSLKDMIIENEFVKNNVKKINDTSELFKYFLSNKEKKTRNGYIIKNENKEEKSNNDSKQDKIPQVNNNNNNYNNNNNQTPSPSEQNSSPIPTQLLNSTKLKKKKMSYQNDLIEEVEDTENKKENSSNISVTKKQSNEPQKKVPRKKNVKMDIQKNKDTTNNLTES